ncbi:MAG: ornithine cyclodeaminase family protein [bacterium]
MLCINGKQMHSVVSYKEIIDKIEEAFRIQQSGNFSMPDRMHAEYKGNTLLLMPCFTTAAMGTKLVTLFPENVNKGLPRLYGEMILNNAETGEPLALMNGAVLTALRTGAVGGVGVKYISPPDVAVLGIVGTGVQGFFQAVYATLIRPIKKVVIFDPDQKNMEHFEKHYSQQFKIIPIKKAGSVEELAEISEVIITATNSHKPVLPDDKDLLKGKHIIGIGSYKPNMQEFPEALFKLTPKIFVDTDLAKQESGDLTAPLQKGWIDGKQVVPLGKLVTGEANIDPRGQTTLFKSVGMALFDLLTADYIYKKAKEEKVGIEVDL